MSHRPLLASALFLWAFAAAPVLGQPAHLLRDIATGDDQSTFGDSNPGQLTPFGTKVAFVAQEPSSGAEVWVADSESGRVQPLGDICRDYCIEGPQIAGVLGSTLFFVEERAQGQDRLLWASDGTARGTRVVLESRSVAGTALLPDRLLFLVPGPSGLELWRTDATGNATAVATLTVGAEVVGFPVSGNRAFLVLRNVSPLEIWSTDGSTAGTHKLATLTVTSPGLMLQTATATHLFIVVNTVGGQELWASDGTAAGTRAVSSFAAPEAFEQTFWLKPIGSHVYFFADDITHGRELWRSDGTPQGTVRTTEFGYADAFGDYSDDDQVEELNGKIFFFATDGFSPRRLWTSNGSPASTRELSDVCVDPCELFDEPWLRRLGNRLIFPAYAGFASELWFTDGTAAGSGPLDSCPGACVLVLSRPRVLADRLYFVASSGSSGDELWSSNGTPAGTHQVSGFDDFDPFFVPFPGSEPPEVVAAGGRLWFGADQSPYGQELWSSAGTPETTTLAADISRGAASSAPASFAALGDRVLFAAGRCDVRGYDLWSSDGTSTQRLSPPESSCSADNVDPEQPILAGGAHGFFWQDQFTANLWRTDGTPGGLVELRAFPDLSFAPATVAVDGGVAFAVQDPDTGANALWRSDGTAGGTVKRLDLPTTYPQSMFGDGASVYFIANVPGALSQQVWRADVGSGALIQLTSFDIGDSLVYGGAPRFTRLGSLVYFWLDIAGHRLALWRSDGTPAGTVAVFDLPAAADFAVFSMAQAAGALYFHTNAAGPPGYQLWRTDGSAAGPTLLGTFRGRRPYELPPFDLAAANGKVVFVGDDVEQGHEPWSTDGTPQGTRLLRDVLAGPGDSLPTEITGAGNRVFFTAGDAAHGRELWQSDGTEAGTRLVHDIAPDAVSSEPMHLTVAGSSLFFSADDGLTGREPWALPLAANPVCVASDTVLCLGGGRFRVEAVWRDFDENTGIGHAAPLTADTGTFWFFSPSNTEVILKVLDGRGLNDHQWVFYGALSSVEYTLTVTDTETGAVRRYFNPAGRLASVGDTEAFGPRGAAAARRAARLAATPSPPPLVAERREPAAKTVCVPSATRLCLTGGRFAVDVAWRDFTEHTGVGTGTALSTDTGDFWFFSSDNIELVVKVLDGRPVNGKFWLFYGALSSVEYTLTVTDTQTGTVRTYTNPSGRLASVADTSAF